MRILLPVAVILAALPLPGAGAQASGGGAAEGSPFFVAMEEIRAPIVDLDRATGTLQVKLVLEVADAAAAEELTVELPSLRADALGAALEFARLDASALRAVDAERLSKDLGAAMHKADARIIRVLIVQVSAQAS